MPNVYYYMRVSSKSQNEDRQIDAIRELEVPEENIYLDRQSGKDFQRPEYQKMLHRLQKDDILYIKSIDRLGRNYTEILEQWAFLTREKQVDIVVLDMPLLDTHKDKDLMGTLIADLVLQLLSFVAENERISIHQRQAEGIASAKARGVQFGRPASPLPEDFPEAVACWNRGEITCVEAARRCDMPVTSFRYRAEVFNRESGEAAASQA